MPRTCDSIYRKIVPIRHSYFDFEKHKLSSEYIYLSYCSQMHGSEASSAASSNRGSFKIKLPKVDVQDCSDNEENARLVKSPKVLTPPQCTPRSNSPIRTPTKKDAPPLTKEAERAENRQYLQVGNPSSIFRLPKPQVKLLKKTASVKQLYNSVLHAIKTIASSRDDIMPELTKTFFENILR